MIIRCAVPLLLATGPAMAHGGHVSAEGGWHAFLHLAAPLAFVVLTLAGAVALTGRVVRRRVDDGR